MEHRQDQVAMGATVDVTQRFELTTSLSFPLLAPGHLAAMAAKLDSAVYEETGDVPTVTAYFVSADHEAGEITIGLRFEGIDARYISETAGDMIKGALARMSEHGEPRLSPVREGSMLVPA